MRVIADIESNGLLDTINEVHCICIDIEDKIYEFGPDHIDTALQILKDADTVVFHNGIAFDIPALKIVYGFEYRGRVLDTMVLSQILWPERPRGHSLDAWGETLGYPKVQHEDWSTFTPEMLHRCTVDVEITKKVLRNFEQEAGGEIYGSEYPYNKQDLGL